MSHFISGFIGTGYLLFKKKIFGDFYSSKCLLFVYYILQYIQNLKFCSILLYSVSVILWIFSDFLTNISASSSCEAANIFALFVNF